MIKPRSLFILSVLILSSHDCFSYFTEDDAGTAGAQFLKVGVGARAVAMGEAFGAVCEDANTVYWNPSGLNILHRKEASFSHTVWFEDINYENASFVIPAKSGSFGLLLSYVSMGSIDKVDNQGNESGESFTPVDMALCAGYGSAIGKKFRLGAVVKYISSRIEDESASAFAADAGILYRAKENKLNFGFVVQNAGTQLKYIEEGYSLPLNIKIASAFKLKKRKLLLTLDLNAPIDNSPRLNAGVEYNYRQSKLLFSPRVGYKTNTKGQEGDFVSGISGGIGIKYLSIATDYAWVPYGDLGQAHIITLSMKF